MTHCQFCCLTLTNLFFTDVWRSTRRKDVEIGGMSSEVNVTIGIDDALEMGTQASD